MQGAWNDDPRFAAVSADALAVATDRSATCLDRAARRLDCPEADASLAGWRCNVAGKCVPRGVAEMGAWTGRTVRGERRSNQSVASVGAARAQTFPSRATDLRHTPRVTAGNS
jgi:hypothetical protein